MNIPLSDQLKKYNLDITTTYCPKKLASAIQSLSSDDFKKIISLPQMENKSLFPQPSSSASQTSTSSGPISVEINLLETIHILILDYFLSTNSHIQKNKGILPFNSKVLDKSKGMIYNVDNLPLELQHMLYKFLKITTNLD